MWVPSLNPQPNEKFKKTRISLCLWANRIDWSFVR